MFRHSVESTVEYSVISEIRLKKELKKVLRKKTPVNGLNVYEHVLAVFFI